MYTIHDLAAHVHDTTRKGMDAATGIIDAHIERMNSRGANIDPSNISEAQAQRILAAVFA